MIDAAQLRHHRTLAGLSQRKLATLAGLGPLGIHRLEAGSDGSRLPLKVIMRVAAALGTTVDQLLETPDAAATEPAAADPTNALTPPVPLDANQGRLLRRLHRGDDVKCRLTRAERELVLPALLRAGVVVVHESAQPALAPAVQTALTMPGATVAF